MKSFDIKIAGEFNLDLILYGLTQAMPLERELLATDFRAMLGSSSAILTFLLGSGRACARCGPYHPLDTNDDPENKWGDMLGPLLGLIDVQPPNEAEACGIAHQTPLTRRLKCFRSAYHV